jgi:hypothetical protein
MPRAAKASASASIASSQQSQSQSPPYPSAGSSTGAGTATDEANLPSDPKARRRERNRLAASAFRTRKKERLGELEVRLAELEEENRLLKDQVDELRATVRELGGIVLGEEDGEGDGGWAAAAGEYGSISGVKREREDEEDDGHGLIRSIEEKDEEGADADRTLVHSYVYPSSSTPQACLTCHPFLHHTHAHRYSSASPYSGQTTNSKPIQMTSSIHLSFPLSLLLLPLHIPRPSPTRSLSLPFPLSPPSRLPRPQHQRNRS